MVMTTIFTQNHRIEHFQLLLLFLPLNTLLPPFWNQESLGRSITVHNIKRGVQIQ